MFVVVALSMSLWITGWVPLIRTVTVSILTWIIDLLTRVLTFIADLPYARMELSIGNWWQVLTFYAVVILVYLWLAEKRTHRLVQALACVAAAGILGLCQNFVI